MVQFENFTWGFQVQFVGVQFTAIALFSIIALREPTRATILASVTLQIVATYTLASGIAAAFIAPALALLLGRGFRFPIVLFGCAVSLLATYLSGYVHPGQHADPMAALAHIVHVAGYALAVVGNPAGNAAAVLMPATSTTIARDVGAAVLALYLALALIAVLRHRTGPVMAIVATGAFVFVSAIATAAGRHTLDPSTALAFRYATPSILLWSCVIVLAGACLRRAAAATLAALALLPVIATQGAFIDRAVDTTNHRAASIPFLLSGVGGIEFLRYSSPDFGVIDREIDVLHAAHASVFADLWAGWIGTPLLDHAAVSPPTACSGTFDWAATSIAPPRGGWRVQGYITDDAAHARRKIVLADDRGLVNGYALSNGDPWLGAGHPTAPDGMAHWTGGLAGSNPGDAWAYAVLDDGRVCPLGSAGPVLQAPAVDLTTDRGGAMPTGGNVDTISLGAEADVVGWGFFGTTAGGAVVFVDTDLPAERAALTLMPRPDVAIEMRSPALDESGFTLHLAMRPGASIPEAPRLCLWTSDPTFGRHRIEMPDGRSLCPK